ncbi:DMT family transporter [Campylobacter mucosalis]|uniref:Putative membrane protein, putative permease (EamA domain), type 3 n=1 Tax=Campylobacter mucosalis CCUG 21559 TaxID=1032067 RepID=A0A6G5QEP2_9BACT|nr:DMT family transporter [Campylobacter mucosalis]QCD44150.1 putative membrane protein, putative permease (EamA domain), type 3 [Campylobacter mucosalis CCUG 21559]
MHKFAKSDFFGVFITILGAILWAFSGVCGQYMFEQKGVNADWLVSYRLILAGLALVIYVLFKSPTIVLLPLKNKKLLPYLICYGVFGLMMTQYTYFCAIELSNAAVATIIQYSAPTMILFIICFIEKRLPLAKEILALILTIVGIVLLTTHGDIGSLVISKKALAFAIISAVGVCIYTILPRRLNQTYPIALNLGLGMLLGGAILAVFTRVWQFNGVNDFSGYAALFGVVVLGTIFSFVFYMTGVKLIGATKASLIACIEPVSAMIFAYFLLGVRFVFLDIVGSFFIILSIFLVAKIKGNS